MNLLQLPKAIKQKNVKTSCVRQVIALSALSLLAAPSFAQTGFDFSLKGMIQSSSLINFKDQSAGNELNFKDRLGVGGGIGAGYSFTKKIGAEIDILFSPQGTQYTGDATLIPAVDKGLFCNELQRIAAADKIPFTSFYTASAYLNYIKIPFLFRFNGKNTKRVYFSMFLGPQVDILSSATMKINGETASLAAYDLKTTDVYKKTGVDGVLGLGLGVNLTKNIVITGHLRLDYGLGDAENKSETYTYQGITQKFYTAGRGTTANATGGALISICYKLVKKEKEEHKKGDTETKTKTKTKTTTTTAPAKKAN